MYSALIITLVLGNRYGHRDWEVPYEWTKDRHLQSRICWSRLWQRKALPWTFTLPQSPCLPSKNLGSWILVFHLNYVVGSTSDPLLFVFEMAYQVTPLTTMPGAKPWRLSGEYRSSERLPQAPNKTHFWRGPAVCLRNGLSSNAVDNHAGGKALAAQWWIPELGKITTGSK